MGEYSNDIMHYQNNQFQNELCRTEHEVMSTHPPPIIVLYGIHTNFGS